MKRVLSWVLGGLLCSCASGQPPTAAVELGGPQRPALAEYNLKDSLALQGYDPVSYFPEGGARPEPGDPGQALRYRGVVYRFSSRANRRRFEAEPGRYEPAYGGWCAWAMARGFRVRIDPLSYTLQDEKLRLFYRNPIVDTRAKWLRGEFQELAGAADDHWARRSEAG
ncbi:MAG: YHS domain-containing (seleno)protein [Nannocystales bacterium]